MGVSFETGGGLLLARPIDKRPEFSELSQRNAAAFDMARRLVALPGGQTNNSPDDNPDASGHGIEWSPWIVTDRREDDRPLPKVVQVQIFSSVHDLEAGATEQSVRVAELLADPIEVAMYSGFVKAPLLVPANVNKISDETGLKVRVQNDRIVFDETKQAILSDQKLIDRINPLSAIIRHFQRNRVGPVVSAFESRMMEIRTAASDVSRNTVLASHLNTQ